MKDGIAIVGAGHGGSQATVSLRQEGYDGPLVLISDETDIPYHRPPLSKAFLRTQDATLQPLRAESVYTDNRIELAFGRRVEEIDLAGRSLMLDRGSRVRFDRLVLATGARPRRLAVPGHDLAGVFYLRSAADARALRDAIPAAGPVAVVGGGFIGLEVAASGDLANWTVPGKLITGMGGAMDLAAGARRLLVLQTHTSKDGTPKLVARLTLPVTALACVDRVITELGVFDCAGDRFRCVELAPGVSREQVVKATGAPVDFEG